MVTFGLQEKKEDKEKSEDSKNERLSKNGKAENRNFVLPNKRLMSQRFLQI